MLDAFIIDEIKRREEERHRRQDENRPRQELPIPHRPPRHEDDPAPSDRGVVIIDYGI
jgi:hypothetical protein